MNVDWQWVGQLAIVALCSIVWWEVRGLRRAKHEDKQVLQWAVFAIGILAKKADIELPPLMRDK